MKKAHAFLNQLGRRDLSRLLRSAKIRPPSTDWWLETSRPLEILCPPVVKDAVDGLADGDKRRISEAIGLELGQPNGANPQIVFRALESLTTTSEDRLLAELFMQRDEMIAVATSSRRIEDANDFYCARRARIAAGLGELGIEDPNPFRDLWEWYRKWKADLPTYALRRAYVRTLYHPRQTRQPRRSVGSGERAYRMEPCRSSTGEGPTSA